MLRYVKLSYDIIGTWPVQLGNFLGNGLIATLAQNQYILFAAIVSAFCIAVVGLCKTALWIRNVLITFYKDYKNIKSGDYKDIKPFEFTDKKN